MPKTKITILLTFLAAVAIGLDLNALKSQLPAPDRDGKLTGPTREAMAKITDAIFAEGRPGVAAVVADLNVISSEDRDYRPRYIVHDLVIRVADNLAERKLLVSVMSEYVQSDAPLNAREYVVQQLQTIDSDGSAGALGSLLSDPDLSPAAAQALTAINTDAARAELLKALPTVKGGEARNVILALGKIGDAEASPALLPFAESADPATRIAAVESLGMIGDPSASDALLRAAAEEQGFARSLAGNACLELAERLTKAGKPDKALVVLRSLLASETTAAHSRGAALYNLAAAVGAKAMPEILTALASKDLQLRQMAIQAGAAMPLTAWTKQTRAESPLVRAGVIQIIGSQGGDGAVPPVLAGLDDSDEVVRLAAIFAASLLDHGSLVGPLLTRLTGAKAEAVAAKRSLLQMRGPAFDTALASEVSSGEVGSRLQAIDIVAQRKSQSAQPALLEALGDANADIRKAALKALREMGNREALASVLTLLKSGDTRERREAEAAASGICKRERGGSFQAVSQALVSSSGELRAALLRVSSQIGGKDAVKLVLASVADSDPAVKDAAVRSLSEWPDGAAIQPLLDIIASDASQSQHVLAVRGALRLIGEERSKDPDKVAKIAKVLASARRPEERKLALSTLSNLKHPAALQTSATYLENVDLKVEAGLAVFKIAERIYKSHPAPSKEALSKLIATSADQKLKDRASKLLQKFAPEVPTLP